MKKIAESGFGTLVVLASLLSLSLFGVATTTADVVKTRTLEDVFSPTPVASRAAESQLEYELFGTLGGGQHEFGGAGFGALPDGLAGTPPQFGPPLNITFNVTGLQSPVTEVEVTYTLTHTWVGDVEVVLFAPGGSPSLDTASRIGVTSSGSFGDSSNYNGNYGFSDDAPSAAIDHIWSKALGTNGNPACTDACNVATGTYRTSGPGQTGQLNPPPLTSLRTTFGGLTAAQANGTWTLRFRDAGAGDTGPVTNAVLYIEERFIFADGFNSGGTGAWSAVCNGC
jgi:hypothetical protein